MRALLWRGLKVVVGSMATRHDSMPEARPVFLALPIKAKANGAPSSCCKMLSTTSSHRARGGLPRFFVDRLPQSQGLIVPVEGDEFWHMAKVLRLGINDKVELFDGRGTIVEGVVIRVGRNSIDVSATQNIQSIAPIGPHWHVAAAFASLKGGRGDWLVEKCTHPCLELVNSIVQELGARSVIPLLTERSPAVSENRIDRWNRMVMAATKQCQRLHLMDVKKPTRLDFFLSENSMFDMVLMAEANGAPFAEALPRINCKWNGLLLIGPEGDFTDSEKKAMVHAGAVPVGLGPHRLRVETAAIAMLSTVMILSDSRGVGSYTELDSSE